MKTENKENVNCKITFISRIKNTGIIIALSFLLINSGYSQIKFGGYGSAGYKWYDRDPIVENNKLVYYEIKLESEIEYNDNLSAEFDFHGESDDQVAKIKEFSIKFEYFDYIKFKIGQLKKTFGVEQLTSRDEYFTIDDSYLKRMYSLQEYGGRAMTFMTYYKNDLEKENYKKEIIKKIKKKEKK